MVLSKASVSQPGVGGGGPRPLLTCTNAVAIRTPVPKCLQAKKTFGGTLSHLIFFAATGKPAPTKPGKQRTQQISTEMEAQMGSDLDMMQVVQGLERVGSLDSCHSHLRRCVFKKNKKKHEIRTKAEHVKKHIILLGLSVTSAATLGLRFSHTENEDSGRG